MVDTSRPVRFRLDPDAHATEIGDGIGAQGIGYPVEIVVQKVESGITQTSVREQ